MQFRTNKNKISFNRLKLSMLIENDKRTDQNIADILEVHRNTVGYWRRMEKSPSAEAIALIASLYSKDANYFYDIETEGGNELVEAIEITDGNEYLTKRFEQIVVENAELKAKLAKYEKAQDTSYSLQDVRTDQVAETQIELKK